MQRSILKFRRTFSRRPSLCESLEPRLLCDGDWGDGLGSIWGDIVDNWPTDTAPADTQPATQPENDSGSDTSRDNSQTDDSTYDDASAPPIYVSQPPNAPSHLTLQSPAPSSIYLSWSDNSSDESNFKVARLGRNGRWSTIAVLPANTTHFTDKGLQPGTDYSYAVAAFNADGFSPYSNIATLLLPNATDPTLIGSFGHLPGGPSSVPFSFFDTDGTQVTLTMKGPGTGMLHLDDNGYKIALSGTTLTTSLHITTRKTAATGDDGRFDLNSLTAGNPVDSADHTALGSLIGKNVDLTGNLTINGSARNITLGNVAQGALHIGGNLQALSLGDVADATLSTGNNIGRLTLTAGETLQIDANAIGQMIVQNNLSNSQLHLRQPVSPSTPALSNLTIHGQLIQSQFDSAGNLGTLLVGAIDHSNIITGNPNGTASAFSNLTALATTNAKNLPTIKSLTFTGLKAYPANPVLTQSTLVAANIGRLTLPKRLSAINPMDASNDFGLAATHISSYTGPALLARP